MIHVFFWILPPHPTPSSFCVFLFNTIVCFIIIIIIIVQVMEGLLKKADADFMALLKATEDEEAGL